MYSQKIIRLPLYHPLRLSVRWKHFYAFHAESERGRERRRRRAEGREAEEAHARERAAEREMIVCTFHGTLPSFVLLSFFLSEMVSNSTETRMRMIFTVETHSFCLKRLEICASFRFGWISRPRKSRTPQRAMTTLLIFSLSRVRQTQP